MHWFGNLKEISPELIGLRGRNDESDDSEKAIEN